MTESVLTYFGRDTLLTLRLLLSTNALRPRAIEAILAGVLERVNSTDGRVAHEETIGDYASFVSPCLVLHNSALEPRLLRSTSTIIRATWAISPFMTTR